MGDDTGVSAKAGVGLVTGGLGFTGPFPNDTTDFLGGEVTHEFENGKLALIYYHGSAKDEFSQDDLPIPDSLKDLISFSQVRVASMHFGLVEWRWGQKPLFERGRLTLVRPEVGFGLGAFYISTTIDTGSVKTVSATKLITTGSISLDLVKYGPLSLSMGVRLFAGQAFGIMEESGVRFEF